MIQLRSQVIAADNTGAHILSVIQVYRRGNKKIAYVGDMINCVVKKADPLGVVKTHEIVKAVVVRARKETRRKDGSYIRFDDNAVVIIDTLADKNPRGTRIFGPVAREVKELGFNKIASMATEVY
ncbi:50S ribosomal protein L14 [Candidatus Gottesmanbacteria bacterium RIFCSPHIGHO2_02_FULL_40_13]|uniref:Large ribosomal subunit protein uL14 n=1 Tax=Candidatus Gottesmanbacteria bacterium RIFCSPHIGHO2_02_FULL_40_13 TaxID=1798384 RepID=A0A1F6A781_9BACT|nr:MAG: 50S ribosomal protein L14 [Candidatus Gottesmanbacteria bacterium RIFCSPHIGHO2_02_FULL_40_13]